MDSHSDQEVAILTPRSRIYQACPSDTDTDHCIPLPLHQGADAAEKVKVKKEKKRPAEPTEAPDADGTPAKKAKKEKKVKAEAAAEGGEDGAPVKKPRKKKAKKDPNLPKQVGPLTNEDYFYTLRPHHFIFQGLGDRV